MDHIFMQNQWESLQHMTCTMSAAMVFLMHHGQFQEEGDGIHGVLNRIVGANVEI
jgi:hypothetical protein